MLKYPSINKIALKIGPIKIYWYGIMYLISFILAWYLARVRAKKLNYNWNNDLISDFIFYCAIGVILGGRLGYIIFYNFSGFIHEPLSIFKVWLGGMSFHGGLLGVVIALIFFARKVKISYLEMLDFTAPLVSIGLALGRIGNFINDELWGKVTTVPWGMVFPSGGPLPRHPSQLYEAFLEGVLLFAIVWLYTSKPKPIGTASGIFLIGYGVARFFCEFFREPDAHIGLIFGWLTMGQLLCIPMIAIGAYLLLGSDPDIRQ